MKKTATFEQMAKYYDNLLLSIRILIGGLMLCAIAINFANVIARRIFDAPFIWAEEILVFIVVWIVYFGAVLVSWHCRHLRMDLLSSILTGPLSLIVNWLTLFVLLGLSIFIVSSSYGVILTLVATGQESIAAGVPMYIPHLAIPVGFSLIFIGTVISAKWQRNGRPPPSRHGVNNDQESLEN